MSLVSQARTRTRAAVAALLGRNPVQTTEVGRGATAATLETILARQFQVSYARTQIHKDLHRMDRADEIVSFAFNTIANRAVGMEDPTLDAFEVTVQAEGDAGKRALKTAQREIDDLVRRLKLRGEAWQIVRRFVKWGNEFREVLIDSKTMDIVGLKELPEHTLWPMTDDKGNKLPGYFQRPENTPADTKNQIQFAEWEVLHFPFGELDGYIGTPLLGCARHNWKRINMAEDSTAAARIVRAFAKLIHKVPTRSDWNVPQQLSAINMYKDAMAKRPVFNQDLSTVDLVNDPTSINTDYYIPDDGSGRGGVEMIDPENAQLQNIKDIEHFIDRLITATSIPKRYFPFEGSIPKLSEGGGQAEDKHYACTLMFCQQILKEGLSTLFDRQLVLKGIDPNSVRYVIRMADINTTDALRGAQTQMALAKTMDTLLERYPEMRPHLEVVLREFTRMSDASKNTLISGITISEEQPPEEPGKNGDGKDDRIQLPGAGNKDAREKV